MNNINKLIKVSSLGLVALLASCSGNKAATLRKITPETAAYVAYNISTQREIDRRDLARRNPEAKSNPIYQYARFPYIAKTLSADITYTNKSEMEGEIPNAVELNEFESVKIKKHIFFDMDKIFFHSHIKVDVTTKTPVKISYPETDLYLFFIEDKEQEEGTEEFQKVGTGYVLLNSGNLQKLAVSSDHQTKTEFIENKVISCFNDPQPIFDPLNASGNPFQMNYAISSGLSSVTTNWNIIDVITEEAGLSSPVEKDANALLMQDWLLAVASGGIQNNFESIRVGMLAKEEEHTCFNYTFRSSDAKSLGADVDANIYIKDDSGDYSLETTQGESSSFAFRNCYLSESHFKISSNTKISSKETSEVYANTKTYTSCDQYVKYDTDEVDDIPEDYYEYVPYTQSSGK